MQEINKSLLLETLKTLEEAEIYFIINILHLEVVEKVSFIEDEIHKKWRHGFMTLLLFSLGLFIALFVIRNTNLIVWAFPIIFILLVPLTIIVSIKLKRNTKDLIHKREELTQELVELYKENPKVGLRVFSDKSELRKIINSLPNTEISKSIKKAVEYSTYLLTRKLVLNI